MSWPAKLEWLREPVQRPGSGRHAPRMIRALPALLLTAIGGISAGWILFVGLARLIGNDIQWLWPNTGSLDEEQLFDVTRSSATIAALLGGLFAIVYAYRKQRVEEANGHRADAEALSKRYQDAAEQLGHGKAAVRLAGAYAMARLANDWSEQRQTCIDVICAYLRMPWPSDGDMEQSAEEQVRRSIVALINSNVDRESSDSSWSTNNFDFSMAELRSFRLSRAHFAGRVTFHHSTFLGSCSVQDVRFDRGVDFDHCTINGDLSLSALRAGSESAITLDGTKVRFDGHLTIATSFDEGIGSSRNLALRDMSNDGEINLALMHARNAQPPIIMDSLRAKQGRVVIREAVLLSKDPELCHLPRVRARNWHVGESASIQIDESIIDRGDFDFSDWRGEVPEQFVEGV